MKPLRIGVVGAGPAGLYAALLLKKTNPAHEVRVIERNPAGATYGFGIVLSDRTLGSFRAADGASFEQMTAHQSSWHAIDVFHRGERVRCEGHDYLGIARARLLQILGRRCEDLGVQVTYGAELRDLSMFQGDDLIVAADGVNSLVRSLHAAAFEPALASGRSKYIWLGLRWSPQAFTFAFHQTEHGLFQAHMYPYAAEMATCVLMCSEETWRRAGLDRMSEPESVTFCQQLLAPYTDGAEAVSNRSLWHTFCTVRNRRWSHEKMVLLGDAAHTAHWSIGSGTKLAMEDAIALVRSLEEESDIDGALLRYELERRPVVERLQAAGRISERYCETAEQSMGLSPLQFAFQLMSRSGRMDYAELRRRDPAFIGRLEALFGGEPVTAPLRVGGLTLPNRMVARSSPARGAGLVMLDDLDQAAVLRSQFGGLIGLRLKAGGTLGLVSTAVEAGIDLLEVPAESLSLFRGAWPAERPLAIAVSDVRAITPGGFDLITLDTTEAAVGEAVKHATGVPVMLVAASRTAANTLVAGARADLCCMLP